MCSNYFLKNDRKYTINLYPIVDYIIKQLLELVLVTAWKQR